MSASDPTAREHHTEVTEQISIAFSAFMSCHPLWPRGSEPESTCSIECHLFVLGPLTHTTPLYPPDYSSPDLGLLILNHRTAHHLAPSPGPGPAPC